MTKSKLPKIPTDPRTQKLIDKVNNDGTRDDVVNFMAGGEWLVDAVRRYGINEQLEPLRLSPIMLEHLRLIGDFRIAEVYTSGAAQVFKTLNHLQLVSALITVGRRNFATILPNEHNINKLVPGGFKPIVNEWEKKLGLTRKMLVSDSKSMSIHQSRYGTGRFLSANNQLAKSKEFDGTAKAASGAVSFSTDMLNIDERSQFLPNAIDAYKRRLLQARIETRPIRTTGTPGNGNGIEYDMDLCDYLFVPHIKCTNCKKFVELNVYGVLLKNFGDLVEQYLSDTGQPVEWHHHDPNDKINTAYYACPNCLTEITKKQCLGSKFRCTKSGVWLSQFLDNLPKSAPPHPISAGVMLPPMLRDRDLTSAPDIIRKGMSIATDLVDWAQQELGVPTQVKSSGFTVDRLNVCCRSIPPDATPYKTYWGLDQGTRWHYMAIVRYHLPPDTENMTDLEIYLSSIRHVTFLNKITATEMLLRIGDSSGGALDSEPDRIWSSEIANRYRGVVAIDQVSKLKQAVNPGLTWLGGISYPVLKIDTDLFQSLILRSFNADNRYTGGSNFCFPEIDTTDLSTGSIARQLTSSIFDPATGVWQRPIDKDDDLLKALVFAEVRFYCDVCNVDLSFMNDLSSLNI